MQRMKEATTMVRVVEARTPNLLEEIVSRSEPSILDEVVAQTEKPKRVPWNKGKRFKWVVEERRTRTYHHMPCQICFDPFCPLGSRVRGPDSVTYTRRLVEITD